MATFTTASRWTAALTLTPTLTPNPNPNPNPKPAPNPNQVRAVAQDRRLFSAELYLSEWSHAPHPGEVEGEGEYPGEVEAPGEVESPGEQQNQGRGAERRLAEATPVAAALALALGDADGAP